MVDDGSSAAAPAHGEGLLRELLAINDEIDASQQEMARLVGLAELPDGSTLSTARLRFSRALRRHLQHVDGPILSHLRTTADPRAKPTLDAFRLLLQEYHEAAAHHVARWPSTSVTADWDGYRRSVNDMLARLRNRIAVERRDIHPLLAGAGRR